LVARARQRRVFWEKERLFSILARKRGAKKKGPHGASSPLFVLLAEDLSKGRGEILGGAVGEAHFRAPAQHCLGGTLDEHDGLGRSSAENTH